jgi:beta-phosphoglucomutase-like phosphatase (HAD superfamily)
MHMLARGRAGPSAGRASSPAAATPTAPRRRRPSLRASATSSPDHARRAFADPHLPPLPPGSEHGEAFSAMAGLFGSGGARRLDVDALNEAMQPTGALRLRHTIAPDSAHGAIFAFDSVVADLAPVKEAAWRLLAKRRGFALTEAQLRAVDLKGAHLAPDAVAARVLGWARSWEEARSLALEHAALGAELLASEGPDLLMEALGGGDGGGGGGASSSSSSSSAAATSQPHPLARARDGAAEWLSALSRHGVPLAAVSSLDRRTLQRCLDRVGLHDHFDALVSADDEPESLAERLLMASVKLNRPPSACASFDATPEGVTAAHNASMRCVACAGGGAGIHRHALRGADLTVFSLRELSVVNLRRLFAGADAPGRLTLAREKGERERDGGGGGGGDGDGDGAARWRHRWSSRRAVVAAASGPP